MINTNIKHLRKQHRLTLSFVANKLGLKSKGTIKAYEDSISEPNIASLIILSTLFKVSIDDLIKKDLTKTFRCTGKPNKKMDKLTFGQALELVKKGKMVQREGWNGKGMFIFQADILDYGARDKVMQVLKPVNDSIVETSRFMGTTIVLKSADNKLVFGWLASQTDMMANDWIEC